MSEHISRTCASVGWCRPGWSSKPPKTLRSTWLLPVSNFEEIFLLSPNKYPQKYEPLFEPQHFHEPKCGTWSKWLAKHTLLINNKDLSTFQGFIDIKLHNSLSYWRSNSHDFSSFLHQLPLSQTTHVFSASSPSLLHGTQETEASSILTISFFIVLQWMWGSVTA